MKFKGVDKMVGRLKKADKVMISSTERGMWKAAGQCLNDCIIKTPTVPLKEGTLRGSGNTAVKIDRTKVIGTVGLNTPYAARHHEVKANFTEPGSGTKYLESKLSRYRNDYMKIIAREIRRVF